jgi:hypothetical protein
MAALERAASAPSAATAAAPTTRATTTSATTTARTALGFNNGADGKQRERGHRGRSEEFQRFHPGHLDNCWRRHRFARPSSLK